MTRPKMHAPAEAFDARVLETFTHGALDELHAFCAQAQAEAAHGKTREDAGQAIAYARVMKRIRTIQARRGA